MTLEQFKRIAPNCKKPEVITDLLNELSPKYGIIGDVFKIFLANVTQESGEFNHKEENMNYRAETLMKVWPSRFPNLGTANEYARQPEKLANFVYGGRMGNKEVGDGWAFRGGGFIGLTGRDTYKAYADYLKITTKDAADLVRTSDKFALDSAFWFFAIHRKLIPVAETGNFVKVVKGINGGTIGLQDRLRYYEACKKFL